MRVLIREIRFTGILSEWFPDFYFMAQKGVKISELVERFWLRKCRRDTKKHRAHDKKSCVSK